MNNFEKRKDWKPCTPGTIRQVSEHRYTKERRRFIARTAMGAVVGCLGLFTGLFAINHGSRRKNATTQLSQDNSSRVGVQIRFSCGDIVERLDEYVLIAESDFVRLNAEQKLFVADFRQHLAVCEHCSEMVDEALNA